MKSRENWMVSTISKYMHIDENRLDTFPSGIRRHIQLRILNLRFNRLTSLPSWIGELIHLREFDCAHNHLKRLPVSLGRLTNLETVDFTGNIDLEQRWQRSIWAERITVQALFRAFRCALECQKVVVTILGTYRIWKRLRLPRDMACELAKQIWRMRRHPNWSE